MLPLILTGVLLVCGCATGAASLLYRAKTPELRAAPSCYSLNLKVRVPCPEKTDEPGRDVGDLIVVVYWTDWTAVIREIRAACIAGGGSATECGAEN